MKLSQTFLIMLTATYTSVAANIGINHINKMRESEEQSEVRIETEHNHAISGMFFSSDYVVEEYEYDDAYVLLYDDADANLYNVEICVDLETYQAVSSAIQNGQELVGSLVLNEDYSYDGISVFTYISDPELTMAQASAKR